MGDYIQLIFAKLHCIISLTVNSKTPLTGIEEMLVSFFVKKFLILEKSFVL